MIFDDNRLISFGLHDEYDIDEKTKTYDKVIHKPKIFDETIKSISSGFYHSLLVTENGNLYGSGCGSEGQLWGLNGHLSISHQSDDFPIDIRQELKRFNKIEMNNVISTSCGSLHSLIITKEGLFSCGNNTYGQLGRKSFFHQEYQEYKISMNNVISSKCGPHYSFVLTKEGLFACGENTYGQLGLGTRNIHLNFYHTFQLTNIKEDVIAYDCSRSATFVLKNDGLYYSGILSLNQQVKSFSLIVSNHKIISISCGMDHVLMLTSQGLFVLGLENNRLDALASLVGRPTQFLKLEICNIISFSCGLDHSIIITKEGIYGFGSNNNHQLGLSESYNSNKITRLPIEF
jgi:alpha-tubulin suppressor-like RCC1 family protein